MKRLIATKQTAFDIKGNNLGTIVEEVDCYTKEEYKQLDCCPECGLADGNHREYFIKTDQHPGGEVRGYYQMCSRRRTG